MKKWLRCWLRVVVRRLKKNQHSFYLPKP
jgi:hypothetical protein